MFSVPFHISLYYMNIENSSIITDVLYCISVFSYKYINSYLIQATEVKYM